jgi:hypothetical protein
VTAMLSTSTAQVPIVSHLSATLLSPAVRWTGKLAVVHAVERGKLRIDALSPLTSSDCVRTLLLRFWKRTWSA